MSDDVSRSTVLRAAPGGAVLVERADREAARYHSFRTLHGLVDDNDAVMLYLANLLDTLHLSGNSLRTCLHHLDVHKALQGDVLPSRDRHVRAFLRGLHQEAALGPITERQPLYPEQLRAIIDTIDQDRAEQALEVALLLLANATGLSSRALAHLTWNDLRITGAKATVDVRPRGRAVGPTGRLEISAQQFPRTLEALRSAKRLVGPAQGAMFARRNGAPPSWVALAPILQRLPGRAAPWRWSLLQPSAEGGLDREVHELSQPRPRQLRDVALLLLGFSAALHDDEASNLAVRDIEVTDAGLLVRVRGRTKAVAVPRWHAAAYDPTSRWLSWMEEYRRQGADDASPAFPPIVREVILAPRGGLGQIGLIGVVRHRAACARLDGNFTFTSLRAGFLRTSAREGVPEYLVLQQAGLVRLHSLERHRRREELVRDSVVGLLGL